jgi:hypothetical protein
MATTHVVIVVLARSDKLETLITVHVVGGFAKDFTLSPIKEILNGSDFFIIIIPLATAPIKQHATFTIVVFLCPICV